MAQDTYNPGREAVQAVAAPTLQSEKARFDPNGSVNQLIAALGADSTQREIAAFNQRHEQKKLQEQALKLDWYVEQFSQDHVGGAVSQAQIKERFPETVPVIAARVAEALGQKHGRQQFESAIAEIAQDDTLRLDSTKRSEFLAKKRTELVSQIGEGNDFFGAGVVAAIDRQIAQHEQNWKAETAAYHEKVQMEDFSDRVTAAFNGADSRNALLQLDESYGKSSSLNTLERNKIVVNTAIDLAFVNDDPKILQSVPVRFLNADSKAALQKASNALTDKRISDFRNAQYLKEVRRAEELRASKIAIVQAAAEGQSINPGQYLNDSEAYEFAMRMREAPHLDESMSRATAQSVRDHILTQTSVSSAGSAEDMTSEILTMPGLNPADRKALIDELPKLVEGRNLMQDSMVRQPIQDRLGPRLQALEQSTNSAIQSLLTGRNLRSEVMGGYDRDIRRLFQAEYEETGRWPTGHRKLELIDKATDRAEILLEKLTRITPSDTAAAAPQAPAAAQTNNRASTPAQAPAAAPRPAPSNLPPGVKLVQ